MFPCNNVNCNTMDDAVASKKTFFLIYLNMESI